MIYIQKRCVLNLKIPDDRERSVRKLVVGGGGEILRGKGGFNWVGGAPACCAQYLVVM